MTEIQLLNNKEFEAKENNMRKWIILYTDILIRGLLAFFIIGVGFYIILVYFFKVNPFYILPVVFIISVFVSPFLSKIKIGEKIWVGYENWLKRVFKECLTDFSKKSIPSIRLGYG